MLVRNDFLLCSIVLKVKNGNKNLDMISFIAFLDKQRKGSIWYVL